MTTALNRTLAVGAAVSGTITLGSYVLGRYYKTNDYLQVFELSSALTQGLVSVCFVNLIFSKS